MSGPSAASGQLNLTAARYGVDKINAAGGWAGQKLEVVAYEVAGMPVTAEMRAFREAWLGSRAAR